MAKVSVSHYYPGAIASADADGVIFVADGHQFVFQMTPLAMRRLARQIDVSLLQKKAPASRHKE